MPREWQNNWLGNQKLAHGQNNWQKMTSFTCLSRGNQQHYFKQDLEGDLLSSSGQLRSRSGLVQVWFNIELKFNFFELDSKVGRLVPLIAPKLVVGGIPYIILFHNNILQPPTIDWHDSVILCQRQFDTVVRINPIQPIQRDTFPMCIPGGPALGPRPQSSLSDTKLLADTALWANK